MGLVTEIMITETYTPYIHLGIRMVTPVPNTHNRIFHRHGTIDSVLSGHCGREAQLEAYQILFCCG